MNEEEKKALKVINTRTKRLLDEFKIEKEDMSDEPKIAYLMQEIRANKTILNLIEKLQKENQELKDLIIHKNEYTKKLEEDLFENCSNYVIPKSKVKDKIEEEKLPLTIVGGRRNRKTLEYGIKLGRRQVLQELIEGKK
jgi:hypothetical protein|nr:MAG TPA: hypothetical protein [Caudoviricetes sp.]